ncbi:efflux RND transporter periplasmic adaptor subunit [Caldisalinibacter kiritimatiensis]|uniref:Putative HlyD family secretion protein n=1 Tax=Caldisalinibacter kiritimatiensis TaxID=1304284 RepID=R1CRW5_9FIRM|nr:efflux RND transporter periplasmic adaptor subunit [Caldisalinibacter kiritimatiensis]EOD01411.1 putative HlyD family secretion protein [Caldisalinibacter kiritimatiensis]
MAKSKKKTLIIVLAVLVGIGIISISVAKAVNTDDAEMTVSTTVVKEESIEANIMNNGIIKAKEEKNVVCSLPYPIEEVFVEEGDKVSKGDILAKLDTQDLEYKVKVAETNLELEKKKFEDMLEGTDTFQLEKNVESAKIAYENAKKKYNTSLTLFEAGAISKSQLDMDNTSLTTAKNNLELAQNQLKEAKENKDLESQRKRIELEELNLKLQKKKLEESIIKSPMDGTVVMSNAKVGIPANTLTPVFVVENLNELEIEINVSEFDINDVKIRQDVSITGEAFKGKEFEGKVSYIAPIATVLNSSAGTETNIKVKIDIDNPTKDVKPGFSADVLIKTARKDKALVVPYESLYQRKDGVTVVFKVDEQNIVREVPVELGIEGDIKVEIMSDSIEVGDKIVLNPNEKIKDGMKVNTIDKGDIE